MKKVKYHGINIELDGIYCKKCNCLHPSLEWHTDYDEYLIKKDYIESVKKSFEKHNIKFNVKDIDYGYNSLLLMKNIEFSQTKGICTICGKETSFKSLINSHYICSDECFYKDEQSSNDSD